MTQSKENTRFVKGDDQVTIKYQNGINSRKKRIVAIIVVVLLIIGISIGIGIAVNASKDKSIGIDGDEVVLLVSLDGFKPEYLTKDLAPSLVKFAEEGVKADYLRPVFPTKTFPNHYSIVTGLYPESHGIVSNNFIDEKFPDAFGIGRPTSFESKWWGGEPIWITAIKKNLISASYFWVGSEAIHPTYWKKYNKSIPWNDRVDQAVIWMKMSKEKRPSLVTMYFEQPDSVSHNNGPFGTKTKSMVRLIDSTMKYLFDQIENNDLKDKVNIVVVSDHGMADVSCNKTILLNELANLTDVNIMGLGASSLFYLDDKVNRTKLRDELQCSDRNLYAFDKKESTVPKRMHYQHNKRIGDFFLVPKKGWSINLRNDSCWEHVKGYHGIDNIEKEMQAIFIASGPAFLSGQTVDHFQNIQIYNLLADLLNIQAAPNNGTKGSLHHLLKPTYRKKVSNPKLFSYNQRLFPNGFDDTLSECKRCTCSYCDNAIVGNVTMYRKNLNLTSNEIKSIHSLHFPWSIPQSSEEDNNTVVLTQKQYVIGYSTTFHIPLWVGYRLTAKQLQTNVKRKNCFRRDIRLTLAETSQCSNYQGSGMDRGHMAPNGDLNFDEYSQQDTFILSNVAPQYPKFNRSPGVWGYLEGLTRNLALKYDTLYVLSGSIFDGNNDGIKDTKNQPKMWIKDIENSVAIPTHFYKILIKCKHSLTDKDIKTCGSDLDILSYVLPHVAEKICKLDNVQDYMVRHTSTIHDIELLTGVHFLSHLRPRDQARLKTALNTKIWPL